MTQNKELKSRENFECLWHLIDFSSFICNSEGFKQSLMVLILEMYAKLTIFKLPFITQYKIAKTDRSLKFHNCICRQILFTYYNVCLFYNIFLLWK